MQLVHIAYQNEKWWLWLEGEFQDLAEDLYPFGGDQQSLEEFWSGFWRAAEEGNEMNESLFWPAPKAEVRSFRLPTLDGEPLPSDFFVCAMSEEKLTLKSYGVAALPILPSEALAICQEASENHRLLPGFRAGPELEFWHGLFGLCDQLVHQGGYLPAIEKKQKQWYSCWRPMPSMGEQEWLLSWNQQAPGVVLCGFQGNRGELSNYIITQELNRLLREEAVRRVNEEKIRKEEGIEKFSPYLQKMIAEGTLSIGGEKANRKESLHDRWMLSLKNENSLIEISSIEGERLNDEIFQWQERFFQWRSAPLRLAIALDEPQSNGVWPVIYWLQSAVNPEIRIPLSELWKGKKEPILEGITWEGSLREWALTTLGAGSLISTKIGFSLRSSSPEGFSLKTSEVVSFLEMDAPRLLENGFILLLPEGWQGSRKLSLKAQGKIQPIWKDQKGTPKNFSLSWNLSLDGEPLTQEEIHALLDSQEDLIEFRGRWVQVDQNEVEKLLSHWKKQPEKILTVAEALQIGLVGEFSDGPMLDRLEMDSTLKSWSEAITQRKFEELPVPEAIHGTLRPYQIRGFSWLAFLAQFGLGGCLADDMGLGKTIQAIAFLAHLKECDPDKPFLLVCPTSLLGNWQRELHKFWPQSQVYIYHGTSRKTEEFQNAVENNGMILTTYSLLSRDEELIGGIPWGAVVLDEAQNIKNPMTRQAQAARNLKSAVRIALTGTPVENHAGDLWSILQFLNPGILPSWGRFQREFLRPIQEEQDEEQLERLRRIAAPFLLRRLKSDPAIAPDLPDKAIIQVICSLGTKQTQLYQRILADAEDRLKNAKGMARRGLILATLTKLKQVCAHPSLVDDSWGAKRADSGKLERLEEMVDEVVDSNGKALIFTQFVEMGRKIRSTLSERLGKPVLFYHGSLSRVDRDTVIERFQKDDNIPVLVLSLRAGGTGLNLTAASHVFHYDRWWNPAVEDQATDRAHRIGQEKDVQVIHLICGGTLEERISELIERKRSVANGLIESGEAWLTELTTQELSKLWGLEERDE